MFATPGAYCWDLNFSGLLYACNTFPSSQVNICLNIPLTADNRANSFLPRPLASFPGSPPKQKIRFIFRQDDGRACIGASIPQQAKIKHKIRKHIRSYLYMNLWRKVYQ